jgi:hypothetical protein
VHTRLASAAAAIILGLASTVVAVPAPAPTPTQAPTQAASAAKDPRVHDLLVLIESADQAAALDAAMELQKIGPSVAPALVETLKTNPRCQAQWVASGVLARLKLEPALVETTLLQMTRGTCKPMSIADLQLQQDAAFAVIDRVSGIELMTALLRGGDLLARRRAAFAFDELTERLRPDHPRPIAATPEIVAATTAALPLLRDVAVSKAHVEIRCTSFEAIDQARRLPIDALRTRATKLLNGVKVDCDPAPGRPAPTGSGPVDPKATASAPKMDRRALEQLIVRLDSQPPSQARQTTAVLLEAGDEVEPLLRQRLLQTNRCRGLALIAGILARRNAVEADVESAFTRVLEGKCDGREAFDELLAQSVAAAFMTRSNGIAAMARLLTHKDVEVRRRAADAFATLFERLGSGEHAQPAAPVDPALLPSVRAALEPLVAFATTERDQAGRCTAVRALLHAQQASDDALRADASAATAGRTIRCLAPPRP